MSWTISEFVFMSKVKGNRVEAVTWILVEGRPCREVSTVLRVHGRVCMCVQGVLICTPVFWTGQFSVTM